MWQPTPALLLGEFHGQKSLAGYSPWGHKELDTNEWLTYFKAFVLFLNRFYLLIPSSLSLPNPYFKLFLFLAQLVKNLPAKGRPGFDPWERKEISRRGERLPTPVFWPGEFHRLYSPWGCKESDTIMNFIFLFFFSFSLLAILHVNILILNVNISCLFIECWVQFWNFIKPLTEFLNF